MNRHNDAGGDHDHPDDEHVVSQTFPAKSCEEARPAGQSHRVDEDHETELEHDVVEPHRRIKRSDGKPHKQHRGDTQAETTDPYPTNQVAESRHNEQQEERVVEDIRKRLEQVQSRARDGEHPLTLA